MVRISYQLDFGDAFQARKNFWVVSHRQAAKEIVRLRKWIKGLKRIHACIIWIRRDGEKEKVFVCVP